jgi:hypothetical protein
LVIAIFLKGIREADALRLSALVRTAAEVARPESPFIIRGELWKIEEGILPSDSEWFINRFAGGVYAYLV